MYIHSFHQILIMILVQYAFAQSLSLWAGYGLVFIDYVQLSFNRVINFDNFNFLKRFLANLLSRTCAKQFCEKINK